MEIAELLVFGHLFVCLFVCLFVVCLLVNICLRVVVFVLDIVGTAFIDHGLIDMYKQGRHARIRAYTRAKCRPPPDALNSFLTLYDTTDNPEQTQVPVWL